MRRVTRNANLETEPVGTRLNVLELALKDLSVAHSEELSILDFLSASASIIRDVVDDLIVVRVLDSVGRIAFLKNPRPGRARLLADLARGLLMREQNDDELSDLINHVESELIPTRREAIPVHVKLALLSEPYRCSYPGCKVRDKLEIDHRRPVKRGGSSHRENLRWLCIKHNRTKGARLARLEL
jgi:hypothetical protein